MTLPEFPPHRDLDDDLADAAALPAPHVQPLRDPVIIPRDRHTISQKDISPNALRVLHRLHEAGHQACLVGGGVRDLLLGRRPKDFDVGTNAHPDTVYKLFRNCRLIGRRFRLAHVHFGSEIIEVATFRASSFAPESDADEGAITAPITRRLSPQAPITNKQGRILQDNVYGTIDDDAQRRDFTVNALYYDIADRSVRDYTGGMADLQAGVLRMIGDPEVRYREDPVRMLRAVRFAAKLGFRIDAATEQPIHRLGDLLADVPAARLFDEVLKLFMAGHGVASFEWLRLYGLFSVLFPGTNACLSGDDSRISRLLIQRLLENTDARVHQDKPVSPAYLFAGLLWPPYVAEYNKLLAKGRLPVDAERLAVDRVLQQQSQRVAIHKRFSLPLRDIWQLQPRFLDRGGKRPQQLAAVPLFRAAYDFFVLRAQADPRLQELADWWRPFHQPDLVVSKPFETPHRPSSPFEGSPPPRGPRRRFPRRRPDEFFPE